jgi:hypothetical protein
MIRGFVSKNSPRAITEADLRGAGSCAAASSSALAA